MTSLLVAGCGGGNSGNNGNSDEGRPADAPDLSNGPVTPRSFQTAAWATAQQFTTSNAFSPQVVFDASGNALAVWIQTDGARNNVWSSRYTAGSGWGTAQLVETYNGGNAQNPQIVMDAQGNALVVWEQHDGFRYNIWANRYTANAGWGIAAPIETDNTGSALNPRIAVDSNGNALAVWDQQDGIRANVWSNRYTAGFGWGTAELIEADNSGEAVFPQIAFDANGNALAVWHQFDGSRYNIWSNRYTAGAGWNTAALIETEDEDNAWNPQIAIDAQGNALAVWFARSGGHYSIWSNRYAANGGWGTAQRIATESGSDAYSPQIAFDKNGNALTVWHQYKGGFANIWSNRYVSGSGWGTAEMIETDNAGDALYPRIASDAKGNGLAVWLQHDGTRYNIWSNRYVAGSGWSTAELIETNNAGDAGDPRIAFDNNGGAMATWRLEAGGHYGIWYNSFN